MMVGQPWVSGRHSEVCGVPRQTGYRKTAYASILPPEKPTDDGGYLDVLNEMARYEESDMRHAPNLLKDWYGISKAEAMRLFNMWIRSLSDEEQLNLF